MYLWCTLQDMNTTFVGVKEFRKNMAKYAVKARKAKGRFVVMNRNKPLFEIAPFPEDASLEKLFAEVLKAERDIASGRYRTHEQILRKLK